VGVHSNHKICFGEFSPDLGVEMKRDYVFLQSFKIGIICLTYYVQPHEWKALPKIFYIMWLWYISKTNCKRNFYLVLFSHPKRVKTPLNGCSLFTVWEDEFKLRLIIEEKLDLPLEYYSSYLIKVNLEYRI